MNEPELDCSSLLLQAHTAYPHVGPTPLYHTHTSALAHAGTHSISIYLSDFISIYLCYIRIIYTRTERRASRLLPRVHTLHTITHAQTCCTSSPCTHSHTSAHTQAQCCTPPPLRVHSLTHNRIHTNTAEQRAAPPRSLTQSHAHAHTAEQRAAHILPVCLRDRLWAGGGPKRHGRHRRLRRMPASDSSIDQPSWQGLLVAHWQGLGFRTRRTLRQ